MPYSGLTLSCEINGETTNFCDTRGLVKPSNKVRFYTMETAVTAEMAKFANESLNAVTPTDSPEHLTQKAARRMDCCAGIAILPTAYPFFRGYEMAEQLCEAAKSAMCAEQIREPEYMGPRGNLHFGPYQVDTDKKSRCDIENLNLCTTQFPYVMAHGN